MISKRENFLPISSSDTSEALLYAITTPLTLTDRSLTDQILYFLEMGIQRIQIREKEIPVSRWIDDAVCACREAHRAGARVLINDRADVALLVQADGVHVGQDDLPPCAVRKLNEEWIIGQSCSSRTEVDHALADPHVDYVAIGPVFASPIKKDESPVGMDLLRYAAGRGKPIIAIGGIDRSNFETVIGAGASMAAMIRGVWNW
ncbi:MAG TPA: thiamine phosphate synthase [Thermoanaerobaculia bacterium]|nr:thiamine phosphate synthase [Thermoanaerobaculia bacterium]HUM30461.1 thiamine phosphate synthase [Thermoanaerobaculia bacterium]HXK68672.1 thiamine phosphate synthase [Thermoanaerobaculia bacterium]